jgi:hypothetical protein
MYHDSSNSYIKNTTGWLNMPLTVNGISIANADFSKNILKGLIDGAVELYHNGSKKIETTAAGATVTGMFNLTGSSSTYSPAMNINSNTQSRAALAIQASHTSLNNANYGVLTLNTVKASGTDFDLITAYTGDYGARVFDVRGDGAVTATSFTGSGAGLTGIDAATVSTTAPSHVGVISKEESSPSKTVKVISPVVVQSGVVYSIV